MRKPYDAPRVLFSRSIAVGSTSTPWGFYAEISINEDEETLCATDYTVEGATEAVIDQFCLSVDEWKEEGRWPGTPPARS